MIIFETENLVLSEFDEQHAGFLLKLVNEPAWIKFIGDKNIHNLEAATEYIEQKLRKSYEVSGFGFYVVDLKSTGESIGICGLVDRDGLEYVDIGFAFLEQYRKLGFGYESATAMLKYAKQVLGINQIVAITHPENKASGKLLEKLGLVFDKLIPFPEDEQEQCRLYVQSGM